MSHILRHADYTIAWIAVLPIEVEAALGALDRRHKGHFESVRTDDYTYIGGEINGHNVVIAKLPAGQNYGVGAAAALVNQVRTRFENIWFALLVGVAAGLPNLSTTDTERRRDIRLGDVLVCLPDKSSTGIIHYDLGRDTERGFENNGRQAEPPAIVRSAIGDIQLIKRPFREGNELATLFEDYIKAANDNKFNYPGQDQDQLFKNEHIEDVVQRESRDDSERTHVWYGRIGSGNSLMRNALHRDELRDRYDLIGLEMEAAGVMNTLPTGVVRGVCDYGDGYKTKTWQPYAAAVAAVYAKAILLNIRPQFLTVIGDDVPGTSNDHDSSNFIGTGNNRQYNSHHSGSGDIHNWGGITGSPIFNFGSTGNVQTRSVTVSQIDEHIHQVYNNGRLHVELLSGKPLPLESCFVNLCIVHHAPDADIRPKKYDSLRNSVTEGQSPFSLATRLKVNLPSKSQQISLSALFEPYTQGSGGQLRPNRILVWGRAGMGKTTLCKKIVHDVCKRGLWKDLYDRVIWLPLRRLKFTKSQSVVELLKIEFSCSDLGERISETIHKLVQDQRTLFLLDGLDEVSLVLAQDSPQQRLLRELLDRPHVIITSRPHSTYELNFQPSDLELETVGFSRQQIDKYLSQMAKEVYTMNKIDKVRIFIRQHPLVHSLAAIPIQLDAICYTWSTKSFPHDNATMSSLYLAISKCLWKNTAIRLGKRSREGEVITREQLAYWSWQDLSNLVKDEITFLQKLAFQGLREEIVEFDVEYIDMLETAQQAIRDKIVHLAFLRSSDASVEAIDRTYHFIHLTFQEFFAAQYFVQRWISKEMEAPQHLKIQGLAIDEDIFNPLEFVRTEKYNDRYDIFWRFVTGLLHGHSEALRSFIETLESEPRDLLGPTHQRTIIHCLSEVPQAHAYRDLQARLTEEYLQWTLFEETVRSHTLIGTLWSNTLIKETECPDDVFIALLQGPPKLRYRSLQILLPQRKVSPRILGIVMDELSKKDADACTKKIAYQMLGRKCDRFSEQRFITFWQSLPRLDLNDRKFAIESLNYKCLQEPAANVLVDLLQDKDATIRSLVVNKLITAARLPRKAVDMLAHLLRNKDGSIHRGVVQALLSQCKFSKEAVNFLLQLLKDQDYDIGPISALIFGEELPKKIVGVLVQLIEDNGSDVGCLIPKMFQDQSPLAQSIVDTLVQLTKDQDPCVRLGTVSLLKHRSQLPAIAIEALVQLLSDERRYICLMAVIALGAQKKLPKRVIEALEEVFRNGIDDWEMQIVAATTLLQHSPETAITFSTQLLENDDPNVRSGAAKAFHWVTPLPEAVFSRLLQLVVDKNPNVRVSAICAFIERGQLPEPVLEALTGLLCDSKEDSGVLSNALSVLREQDHLPKGAVKACIQLLKHEDEDVCSQACGVLEQKSRLSSDIVQDMEQLYKDNDRYVRISSLGILETHDELPEPVVYDLVQMIDPMEKQYLTWSAAARVIGRQRRLPESILRYLLTLPWSTTSIQNVLSVFYDCENLFNIVPSLDLLQMQNLLMIWLFQSFEKPLVCLVKGCTLDIYTKGRLMVSLKFRKDQLETFLRARRELWDKLKVPPPSFNR